RAENNVRIFRCSFLNDRRRFMDFVQRKARAAADVDKNSLRALNRIVFEQRAGNRAIRGVHGTVGTCCNRSSHHGVTLAAHYRFHVREVTIDDAGNGDDVRNALYCLAKMSSAMRNASKKLVPRSTVSIRRSLGITMTVSTAPIRSSSACSACIMRRLPSKANGFVTTATVSAPSSLASEATTGAAPEPVPPPRPDVMKILSAPSSASIILSVSSSAALRPTSGLAPAPRPFVNFAPSCNFIGACESFNACRSVLAVMNSTPSTFARIIRLTALQPPPPTPITLIFEGDSSSLKLMRIPVSFAVIRSPSFGLENRLRSSSQASRDSSFGPPRKAAATTTQNLRRLRTSTSICRRCRQHEAHCAALLRRTKPNRLLLRIPVAPPVPAVQKFL